MKRLLVSLCVLAGPFCGSAEDVLPPQYGFDRYAGMVDHSPFAIATAVAAPAATPDFAKDLYVANAARSPEGDMVTIASTSDRNFKKYLTTKGPVDGYSIANIEWSDRVGETKVTISKDGNFATITFNQALLSQAPQNPAGAGKPFTPPVPMQQQYNPAAQKLPANLPAEMQKLIPAPPQPRRHTRDLIQRNPRGNRSPAK
jgi:hypothetical protein